MAQVNATRAMDEIIQDIRKIKESLAQSLGFDIDRILEEARQRQKTSGRAVLAPPVRQRT